jgi:SPP1 gp7 family putative phage head morphogenesis protein
MMAEIDLKYAFGLPPKKAIRYFESKGNQITWDWSEMLDQAHAKAFTVARVARADVLQDIRTEIDKAIRDGNGFEDFKKNLIPRLKNKGWWGKQIVVDSQGVAKQVQLGSPRRLALIYDTNMQVAFQQGKYQTQKDAATLKPYWQYLTKDDGRVRPAHAVLHQKIFRHDDPIWDHFYPPNGFRCRCRVKALSKRQFDASGQQLESAESKLVKVQRKIGEKEYLTTQYKTETAKGFERITPDAGWDYNPGKAVEPPALKTYSPEMERKLLNELSSSEETKKAFITWAEKTSKDVSIESSRTAGYLNYDVKKAIENTLSQRINPSMEINSDVIRALPETVKAIDINEAITAPDAVLAGGENGAMTLMRKKLKASNTIVEIAFTEKPIRAVSGTVVSVYEAPQKKILREKSLIWGALSDD